MKKLRNNNGFTIVELLISIAIFSVILLIAAAAIIYVGRVYYKGGIITRTQETSRQVIEDVSQAAQFDSISSTIGSGSSGPYRSWCIGSTRYTYQLNTPKTDSNNVLWRDAFSGGSCTPVTAPVDGVELLGENMRISRFDVTKLNGSVTIDIIIAYGDSNDVFVGGDPANGCVGTDSGGQYCAVSPHKTTVFSRLN